MAASPVTSSVRHGIRWHRVPLTFELRSADALVLQRARVVFRPWAGRGATSSRRAWSVEREPSGGWRVHDGIGGVVRVASPEAAVRAVEFGAVQALFESPETTTLHAALVAREGRGVAILGAAEGGKSTLACAVWQRGGSLLGDDVVIVDPGGGHGWSAPRRVGLRHPSRALLGETFWTRVLETPACEVTDEACLFHPDEIDPGPRPERVRLAALVFLRRRGAVPHAGRLTALPAAQALLAVLPYSNVVRRADPGTAIQRFQPLLTAVPAYDLGRGPLHEMAAAVERLLDGAAP